MSDILPPYNEDEVEKGINESLKKIPIDFIINEDPMLESPRMKVIIESTYRTFTCGDGCCYEEWYEIKINGKEVIRIFDSLDTELLNAIFEAIGIELEIVEK